MREAEEAAAEETATEEIEEEPEPKALRNLRKIERAMDVLLTYSSKVRLIGLDQQILLGGPHPNELPEGAKEELEECNVDWDDDQESWAFYTGHG